MHRLNNIFLYITVLIILIIKLISVYFTPVDSDEVMWLVMNDLFINTGKTFLFFTDQNFRGSFESMIIFPFQFYFGVNELVLRANSIIFSFLTMIFIYKIVFEKSNNTIFATSAVLLYFCALPDIFFIQNKAWGGYVAIQFLMLFSYYYLIKYLKDDSKTYKLILLGIISGISFWINEQSIYFIFILLLVTFYFDLISILKKISFKNKLLYLTFFLTNIFSIFYVVIRKRMFIDLGVSFQEKLGFSLDYIDINLYFKDIFLIFGIFFVLFLYLNSITKGFEFVKSRFLSYSVFTFLFFYVNLYFNSFSRVFSEKEFSFSKSLNFFDSIILQSIFGDLKYLYFALILILVIFKLFKLKLLDLENLKIENILFISFILFPILFIFSYLPGLTPTTRYLIIWWPVIVLTLFLVAYNQNFLRIFVYLFVLLWVLNLGINYQSFYNSYLIKNSQQDLYSTKIKDFFDSRMNDCAGGYWDVGLVMFYSDLKIKCHTIKGEGYWYYSFLDIFKPQNSDKTYIFK